MKKPTINATVNPAPIGTKMKNGDATKLVTMPAAGLAALTAPSNASFSSVTSPKACNVSASRPPSLSKNGCWTIDAARRVDDADDDDDDDDGCDTGVKDVRRTAAARGSA